MTLLGREKETGEARGVQGEAGREEVGGWVGACRVYFGTDSVSAREA